MSKLRIVLFWVLLTGSAFAQFTTVTGTVTDPNGLAYANGTITAALVSSGTPKFTASNLPYFPPTQPVGLSSAGSFVMQLADVTALSPGGSTWSFTVSCAGGCVPLVLGKGPITFVVTGVTISGASQSITATLTAAAPALTAVVGGGGSGTVGSGTATQIAFYSASTNAVASNPRLTDNGSTLAYTGASGINAGSGGLTTAGTVTGASGSFTGNVSGSTFVWNSTVAAHTFFGNNTGGALAPALVSLTLGDLPNSVPSTASGTLNFFPKYTATGLPSTLGNSILSDNGSTLAYTGTAVSLPAVTATALSDSGLTQGAPVSVGSGGAMSSSVLYVDAKAFKSGGICTIGTNDDACIAAALATVPSGAGATIDLTGYGNITTANNLFAPLQLGVQPSSAPKCITWLLSATQTITTNGPWLVPTCNHVQVQPNRWAINGGGPVIIPGASYPPCWGIALPCNTAVETTTATTSAANCVNQTCVISVTPTSGTPFTSSMLWSHFGDCTSTTGSWGSACVGAATPNNGCAANGQGSGSLPCIAFGVIIGVNLSAALPNGCGSTNCLLVAVPGVGSGLYGGGTGPANALGVNYVIWAPVVTLGDFNETNINMGVQWEGGAIQTGLTQNIGTGGASPIACANYNSQEESYFRFVQCLPQGTGKGVGLDVEAGSFNSGPYDNVIITFTGNCNTAASQGTGTPLAAVFRQNASSSYPRPFEYTTITGSNCAGGAGLSPLIDWETPSTGQFIHIENGTGNNNDFDLNDGANIVCPVYCPMVAINGLNGGLNDINATTGGASGSLVRVASGSNMKGYTFQRLRINTGNPLTDLATGCTVLGAEGSLALYATTFANNTPTITASTSSTPGCQPQMALTPAVLTGAAYTNATTSFTSVTGLKMPVAASSNIKLTCDITWQGSAATTGPKYQFTGPASPTAVVASMWSNVTASTYTTATAAAFSSPMANAGAVTTATNFTDIVTISVLNGTTTGLVQLQAAANGAGTLTIQPGSYCQ